jgi:LEA14-like dessication related protein
MKARMFFVSSLILVGMMVTSCEFEEPDFSDFSNFQFEELNGKSIDFTFDVTVENPNPLGFKVKNGKIDITANGKNLGTVTLDEKIKIKRKSEKKYTVPLTLDLSAGGLFNMIQLAGAKEVEIKLDGTIRGKVLGFGKDIPIHESRKIDGSMLKLPE